MRGTEGNRVTEMRRTAKREPRIERIMTAKTEMTVLLLRYG